MSISADPHYTRRSLFAGAGVAVVGLSGAAVMLGRVGSDAVSDAPLLAYGPKIAAADAALTAAEAALSSAEETWYATRRRPADGDAIAALIANDAADRAATEASNRLASLVSEALAMPALTLSGLRFKLSLSEHVHDAGDVLAAVATDVGAMKENI